MNSAALADFGLASINGLTNFHFSVTNLPRAGGPSHSQHLPLLQIQTDVFEDRCDVEVGEEEAWVSVWVPIGFVLLLDLLKQLTNALQRRFKSEASLFVRAR